LKNGIPGTPLYFGQAEPTRGRDNHKVESIEFFKTFPDNRLINHPYKRLFQEYTFKVK